MPQRQHACALETMREGMLSTLLGFLSIAVGVPACTALLGLLVSDLGGCTPGLSLSCDSCARMHGSMHCGSMLPGGAGQANGECSFLAPR